MRFQTFISFLKISGAVLLLVFLPPVVSIAKPAEITAKDIRSYLHKQAQLHEFQYEVDLYEHLYDVKKDDAGVSSDTMFQKIMVSAIKRLQARGIKHIVICDVEHFAAAVGSYHLTLMGEGVIGGNRYTVFRIGVYDDQNGFEASDTAHAAGKEMVFYALGKNSNGKRIWFPSGQPTIRNNYMSEDYWEYCDREKMTSLEHQFK